MPTYNLALPPDAAPALAAQQALARALAAYGEGQDAAAHLDTARAALARTAATAPATRTVAELVGAGSPLFTALVEAHQAKQDGRLVGLSTGVDELDKLLGGLRPGLTLVGGVPGGGKTALALNCAVAAAKAGQRVVYLTADEHDERLALKAACIAAGLQVGHFVDGFRHPQDVAQAVADNAWLGNLHFINAHRLDVPTVAAATEGAGLLVVDYLQALAAANAGGNELRHVLDALAAQLRGIATTRRIPVLALSSLNRAGYEKPEMASLRESGGLEFTADVILLLQCDSPEETPRHVFCKVQKNRFGKAFVEVDLHFDPRAMTFAGAPPAEVYGLTRRKQIWASPVKAVKNAEPF